MFFVYSVQSVNIAIDAILRWMVPYHRMYRHLTTKRHHSLGFPLALTSMVFTERILPTVRCAIGSVPLSLGLQIFATIVTASFSSGWQ
jgi:hypothetical protein